MIKKTRKMKKSFIKSRNLFTAISSLEAAGETGIGYKDSPAISQAAVWSDDNTGKHDAIIEAANKNLVPRASIL